jgi:hypothetical protein
MHSQLWHQMEMGGQVYTLSALPLCKEPLAPTELEAEQAQQPVCMCWGTNSLVPAKNEEFLSFPARNPTTIPTELSWLFD